MHLYSPLHAPASSTSAARAFARGEDDCLHGIVWLVEGYSLLQEWDREVSATLAVLIVHAPAVVDATATVMGWKGPASLYYCLESRDR